MGCWRFLAVSLANEPTDPLNGVTWMFSMDFFSFDLTGVRGKLLKTSFLSDALRLASSRVLGDISKAPLAPGDMPKVSPALGDVPQGSEFARLRFALSGVLKGEAK